MHPHEPRFPRARRGLGSERWIWAVAGIVLLLLAGALVWALL